MTVKSLGLLALLAMLAWTRPVNAAESYDNCTGFISTLPAVITTQGTWCLSKDLTTAISSGNAITIATNNVTLDCNNFKIGGLGAGAGTFATGIYADNRLNAEVKNCNIRGFFSGLYFSGASGGGHVVEGNRFEGNTARGLQVEGDGSLVRRNLVVDTGGTTLTNYAYGIVTHYSVDVLDNTVSGAAVAAGTDGSGAGILAFFNAGSSITGNRVRGLAASGPFTTTGILVQSPGRVTLRDNDVVGDGSAGSAGLLCSDSNARAKDNVINGFATAISNCGDAGGNDTNGQPL